MKRPTHYEMFEASPERRRLLRQEELILEATEALACALKQSGITKSELADRLGRTRSFVSQLFGGGRNLTLRTMADVSEALGCRVRVTLHPREIGTVRIFTLVEGSNPVELADWPASVSNSSIVLEQGTESSREEVAA